MSTNTKITTAAATAFFMFTLFIAATAGTVASIGAHITPGNTTPGTSTSGQAPTRPGPGNPHPGPGTLADIPANYLALYQKAAKICPRLGWHVLAAVGKIETNHGRSALPGVTSGQNASGAMGPMQIIKPTWDAILARHRLPLGGATPPSPYNPHDAIHAAAYLLCDSGANRGDIRAALFAYNHATWYVNKVLAQARRYLPTTSSSAAIALAFARAQIGQPYVWGGDGPAEGGFDCSGLSKAAYAAAGINLPRTAHTQYLAGPHLPAGTPAQPGDLIFFGTPTKVHHVAIATGRGTEIIHAPDRGQTVRYGDWRKFPDLLAISRPSTQPTTRNQ